MKKALSFITAFAMAAGMCLQSNLSENSVVKSALRENIMGDLNTDGKTDITDFSMISLFLLKDIELSEEQKKLADLDNDNVVTLSDLARFRQYLSKNVSSLVEPKQAESAKDINAMDVSIKNVLMYDMKSCEVWNTGSLSKSDHEMILSPVANANCGVKSAAINKEATRNFLDFEFTLSENYNHDLSVYLIGKKQTGKNLLILIDTGIKNSGSYSYIIDLNNYVVYQDLDLNTDYYLAVTCTTDNSGDALKFSKFEIYDYVTDLDNVNDVNEAINFLNSSVVATDGKISTMSSNIKMTDENGVKYVLQALNGQLVLVPVLPSKVLYIGNSLLLGFGDFGMAAGNPQEDYYTYINNYIADQGVNAISSRMAGVKWENATSYDEQNTWIANSLIPALDTETQLVIVQLADNVNTDAKKAVFAQGSETLLRTIRTNAPNARVVWVSAWYSSPDVQRMVAEACKKTGCTMVDISALANINGNRSSVGTIYTDSNGTEHTITSSGIASHPSSQGMKAIADKIIETIF